MANVILWSNVAVDYAPVRTGGATQVASWLRAHGYTVKVIDFCHLMSTDNLVEITEKHVSSDTVAIGVSSTFWDSPATLTVKTVREPTWVIDARSRLESRHSGLYWLLGGAKSVFDNFHFSWVKFTGFAEDSVLQWLDQNTGRILRRDLFDISKSEHYRLQDDYIRASEPLPIEFSRGCKFRCKFCSYPLIGKKPGTYMRDFSLIRDEMLYNYEKWGTTKYYFQDDTVNESMEKVESILNLSQSLPFKLEWVGYIRLDLFGPNPDMAVALKESGLRSAHFGIESFHPEASSSIGKGWNGKYAKDYLLKLKEIWGSRINWYMSMIVGLPGETRENILESHQWCIDNEMPAWGFFGLSISRTPTKLWKSEFELNYSEHGYSFEGDSPILWKSDNWSHVEAVTFAKELNSVATSISRPATWLLTELTTLGYDFDDFMNIPRSKIEWDILRQQTSEFVSEYVAYQLKE